MLMVIFGAGASYDSAPSYPPPQAESWRLPLADDLFDDRENFAKAMRLFPDCLSIISFLRDRDEGQSVEQALERLQTECEKHPQGHRELAAIRYYLQRMIWDCQIHWENVHHGVTNYRKLLWLIRQHHSGSGVCLVTFNYDTMLEEALPTLEVKIKTIHDYVTSPKYKVFKVHGSVNWGRKIKGGGFNVQHLSPGQIIHAVIDRAPLISGEKLVSDNYAMMGSFSQQTFDDSSPLFPALAIPVERKQDFVLPPDHLEQLKECISKITKLLVIGWRATDAPFLELLSRNLPPKIPLHVVCGNEKEGNDTATRIQAAGVKPGVTRWDYEGFSMFLKTANAIQFLGG